MKNKKRYYLLLVSAVLSIIGIFSAGMAFAGCNGLDWTIRKYHYEARVIINESEECSIGRYHLIIKTPGGKISNFTSQRDGWIQRIWLEPLGKTTTPSVIVWLQNVGSGSYGIVNVYTPASGQANTYTLLKMASLPSTVKGYEGHDEYTVTDGTIYRAFPRYKSTDPNGCPSGGQALFKYDLQNNQWIEQ